MQLQQPAVRIDDARAAAYARSAVDGEIPAEKARESIGWLIAMSTLPRYWAGRYATGADGYLVDEVCDEITDALVRRCRNPRGVDLEQIAGEVKLSTWAQGLCRKDAFHRTVMRNVKGRRARAGLSVTFSPVAADESFDVAWADSASTLTDTRRATAGAVKERTIVEDIEHWAKRSTKPMYRVHLGARHLARRHGIQIPGVVVTEPERRKIRSELSRSRAAAEAVLDAIAATRTTGVRMSKSTTLSEVLGRTYTTEQLNRIADAPPALSHAIGESFATPRPAVNRSVRGAFVALVAARSKDPEWRSMAGRLVHSFLVGITDLPSESSNGFATARPRPAADGRRDMAAFREVADEAAQFPGSPLGSIASAVEVELINLLTDAETAVAGAAADVEEAELRAKLRAAS